MGIRGAAAIAAMAACLLGAATQARAASPAEVAALQSAPCPAYKALRKLTYTQAQQNAALNGDFDVMLGYHAHLAPPVDWSQNPYKSASWVLALDSFKWIDPLIHTYRAGGPQSLTALTRARDLVLDWMDSNPFPHGRAWSIPSADKAAGDRMGYLAYIVRTAACHGLLTGPQATMALDSLKAHARYLEDPDNLPRGDHAMYMSYGLALLSQYLSFEPRHKQWRTAARNHFWTVIQRRAQMDEGVWLANSPIYTSTVINLIRRWLIDLGPSPRLTRVEEHLRRTLPWFVLPDGGLAPWGDDPAVERPPGWVPRLAHDRSGLHAMTRSGYAVVKTQRSYLGVLASFRNTTHKHRDDLSFELYDHGRRIVTDTGMYGYDRDRWLRFSRSAQAHSGLTVDGRGSQPADYHDEYGSGIRATGQGSGWYAILATNPLTRLRGVAHKRLFLYKPGVELLVLDTLDSHHEHVYRRYFQLGPGIAKHPRGRRLGLAAKGFSGFLSSSGTATRHAVRGRLNPLGGWTFPSFRKRVPRWTVTLRSKASSAAYLSTIGLRGGHSPRAKLLAAWRNGARVALTSPGRGGSVIKVSRRGSALSVQVAHRDRRR